MFHCLSSTGEPRYQDTWWSNAHLKSIFSKRWQGKSFGRWGAEFWLYPYVERKCTCELWTYPKKGVGGGSLWLQCLDFCAGVEHCAALICQSQRLLWLGCTLQGSWGHPEWCSDLVSCSPVILSWPLAPHCLPRRRVLGCLPNTSDVVEHLQKQPNHKGMSQKFCAVHTQA